MVEYLSLQSVLETEKSKDREKVRKQDVIIVNYNDN